MRLALRLKTLRVAADLTLQEASRRMGVSMAFLGTIEADRQHTPVARLPAIAQVYGVAPDELAAHLCDQDFGDRLRLMAADLAAAGRPDAAELVRTALRALPAEHIGSPFERAPDQRARRRERTPVELPDPDAW